ncbi:MAG: hypothetical protein JWN40_3645 [Phycisphaerales bacterium]|nr:hypothetical protein [Phycisphaerales bacterium]
MRRSTSGRRGRSNRDLKSPSPAAIIRRVIARYLRNLSTGRLILWCYFIWYLVVLVRYFDPSPQVWATSFGLCAIIGFALYINTTRSGPQRVLIGFWPTVRLFMMPLCVSSFAAMVKGRGFVLIFSPDWREIAAAVGLCAGLWLARYLARRRD